MTEHLSKEIIDRYRRKSLSGKQRFNADLHIADCSRCREQLGEEQKLQSVFDAVRFNLANITEQTIEHLAGEQMSNFVNKKLDEVDTEIVVSHLAWCSICSAEVEEMEAYCQQLEAENRFDTKEKLTPQGWYLLAGLPDWFNVVQTKIQRPSLVFSAKVLALLTLTASASYVFLNLRSANNSGSQIVKIKQDSNSTSQSNSIASPTVIYTPELPSVNSTRNISLNTSRNNLVDWAGALPAERQLLSDSLLSGTVETMPGLSALRTPGSFMGGSNKPAFALLSPAGQVKRDSRIILKWEPFEGATEYKVTFKDAEQGTTLVTRIVKGTEYQPELQLKPSRRYRWQIIARTEDSDEIYGQWANNPYAEFITIGADELQLVQDAEKHYQPDKDPMAYLALAVRYAKAGLVEDAERMLKTYLKEHPTSPQVIKMLNSLKRQSSK